jgi:hypothetical protein
VPGISLILVAGPFIDTLSAAIDDKETGGLSVLGAAMLRLGIPRGIALRCEHEIRGNRCALVAQHPPELVYKGTNEL